jgi:hypothetical protein
MEVLRIVWPAAAGLPSATGKSKNLWWFGLIGCCLLAGGCATSGDRGFRASRESIPTRQFVFEKDTFSFANELEKEHHYDSEGKWVGHKVEPKPDYSLHCFVVTRSALQFFEHARFAPELPKTDAETYRKLVKEVVGTDPRDVLAETNKIIIPGYADLRSFSREHEQLLKDACGGAWQSYVQRGHWRMVFPFPRIQERRIARRLLANLDRNQPAVVHLVRFPRLSINHAVLIYGARRTAEGIEFKTYDPNTPENPIAIKYVPSEKSFVMATNGYFYGGKIDLYEVYHSLFY